MAVGTALFQVGLINLILTAIYKLLFETNLWWVISCLTSVAAGYAILKQAVKFSLMKRGK